LSNALLIEFPNSSAFDSNLLSLGNIISSQILICIGCMFPLLGNIYRELTILTIDIKEYHKLHLFVPKTKGTFHCWVFRAVIVRMLLYLPVSIWSVIKDTFTFFMSN